MDAEELVRRTILRRLLNFRKIGGCHTAIHHLDSSLPSHITSNKKGRKMIKAVIKELINEQFLLCKISTNELHVSINPQKLKEIKELLELQ